MKLQYPLTKQLGILFAIILALLVFLVIYLFSISNNTTPKTTTVTETTTFPNIIASSPSITETATSSSATTLAIIEGVTKITEIPKTGDYYAVYYDYDDKYHPEKLFYVTQIVEELPALSFLPTGGRASFKVINSYLAKSESTLFYKGQILDEKFDAKTFTIFEETGDAVFAKDKNRVYTINENVIAYLDGADSATFKKMNDVYYKDKNTVYIFYNSIQYPPLRIKGVDGSSFEILRVRAPCSAVEKSRADYAKDKSKVFCGHETIKDADPATFEILGNYDENPSGMYTTSGIAKDKSCIFKGGEKVLDIKGECVSPRSCTETNFEEPIQGERFLKFGCGLK